MKLSSHIIAGIGAGSTVSILSNNHYGALLYVAILSFTMNSIIDLGHVRIGKSVMRSPSTHEILNSVVIAILVGAAAWAAIGSIYEVSLHESLLASLLISGSHLLGDLITRGGIYLRVGAGMLRISVSSYSYRDPIVNTIYVAVFSLPLIMSLVVMLSSPGDIPWYSMIDKLAEIYRAAG